VRELDCITSKSIFVQTQLNYIYYTKLHVSTHLRSSSVSKLVFKTTRERNVSQFYQSFITNWCTGELL